MPTDADADADADADEKTFCPAATICSVSVSTSAWFSSSSDRDQCHHWDISADDVEDDEHDDRDDDGEGDDDGGGDAATSLSSSIGSWLSMMVTLSFLHCQQFILTSPSLLSTSLSGAMSWTYKQADS